jgi:VWFA-related protein
MSRALLFATLVMCVWTITAAPLNIRAQQPTFSARTDVVLVNVSVKRGRQPVVDLRAEDFELMDNGVRQTIDTVSRERVPLDVTLVLTGRGRDHKDEHSQSVVSADATRKLLQPTDRLRIVWVNDDVRGEVFGADYEVLTDGRTRQQSLGFSTGASYDVADTVTSGFGIALTDGLFYALAWPVEPDRRHVVVAFTDGWDSVSTLAPESLPTLASQSDAVLHAVLWTTPSSGPGSGGGRNIHNPGVSREWDASYRALDSAVLRTGGTLQRNARAPEALATILDDFRSSYLLRYTPRGVAPRGWHELKLRVTRPGSFTIRARKGYEG